MPTHRTMVSEPKAVPVTQPDRRPAPLLLDHDECGPFAFSGTADASYERRLVLDHVVKPKRSDTRQRFEAVAWALRDLLSPRWLKTDPTYDRVDPKQVYYHFLSAGETGPK